MKKTDFVVRFAGEGGQGVVTSAEGFAQANAQVGYHVQTFSTFPSQIRGGPTWTQTRISNEEVLSSGDELDVLVAFNEYAYETHKDEVSDTGVIIFNSEEVDLEPDGKSFGMPFDELARSTGNARAANMVVMGALAYLVNIRQEILEDFVTKRFTRGRPNDQQIIESNHEALGLGRAEAEKSGFALGELADPIPPGVDQILINGNQALGLGALAAGLDVYVGYPISPATSLLVWLETNLAGPGKFVYQATSEIESITSIVGAGFAGKKAMTGTAGPGFSLMSEGLGLAWMAEIPLVVADIQRGGPSTGLPTKTEQSDLMTAMYPGTRRRAASHHRAGHRGRVLLRLHSRAQLGGAIPGACGDPQRAYAVRAQPEHPEARPVEDRGRGQKDLPGHERLSQVRELGDLPDAHTGRAGLLRGERV